MNGILYIDVYFLINMIMDILSISIASLIIGEKISIFKIIFAGIFGASAASALLFFEMNGIIKIILSFIFLAVMCLIAFGIARKKKYIIFSVFVLFTELFLGGMVDALYYNFLSVDENEKITLSVFILLCASGYTFWVLWGKQMRRRMETGIISLSISFGDKNIILYGLIDSGNMIREPETDYPVVLIKEDAAISLLGENLISKLKKGDYPDDIPIYKIPVKSIGGENELLGFEPTYFEIFRRKRKKKKRSKNVVIAIDYTKGGFAGCPCLVPLAAV